MTTNDPFTSLFQGLGDFFNDLFGGGGSATPEGDYNHISLWQNDGRILPAKDWPDAAPGSLRSQLTRDIGPRVVASTPSDDTVSQARTNWRNSAPQTGDFVPADTRKVPSKPGHWTATDATWKSLNSYQKAAVMSLMEADGADPEMAKNVLAASVNRAAKNKYDLGQMVGSRWYQPTIEPTQHARLGRLLKHPAYQSLVEWGQRYSAGQEDDPTGGATHFLAHAKTMLALEAKEPQKYRSWRGWSGFDPDINDYRDVTIKDKGHSFVAPEGKFSIARKKFIHDRLAMD